MLELSAEGKSSREIGWLLQRGSSSVRERLRKLHGELPRQYPKALSRPKPPAEGGGIVRCLGGCGQTFVSPDRCRIRICPNCKKRRSRDDVFSTEYALQI